MHVILRKVSFKMAVWRLLIYFSIHVNRAMFDLFIEKVDKYTKELSIKTTNSEMTVGNLSGGNQQKVVLGKELGINPKVLLFNEPTRGIDVGTKSEFYKLIRDLASQGIAVVMYSSDLIELCGMSDKVIVMYEGRMSGCFNADELDENNLMQAAVGMTQAGGQE